MKKLKKFIFFWFLTVGMIAQNQLPLANGSFEATQNGNFDYWINIANEGAEATYSIETEDLIEGSSKALKSDQNIWVFLKIITSVLPPPTSTKQ